MPMLNVFESDAFSVVALTAAIEKVPYKPGRIGELGLFRSEGITATTVVIEEKDGQLTLIETSPRGGVASTIGDKKRTARSFLVPHLARESTIMADAIQNVRAFGSENELASLQSIVNSRLTTLRAMHEVTLEHLRIGAIKGQILDSDGATVLFNLFTEFGVVQQTAELDPDAATDNGDALRNDVVAAQRLIEDELGAEPISGYRAFCGKTFFDSLRADKGVVETLRYADPASLLQQQANARRFSFAGVAWEEYRGSVGAVKFVPDAKAYLLPEGSDIFRTYFAPADFVETVNTLGLPIYAKQATDQEFQRWVKLHTQSNPLPLCTRPRCVVELSLAT